MRLLGEFATQRRQVEASAEQLQAVEDTIEQFEARLSGLDTPGREVDPDRALTPLQTVSHLIERLDEAREADRQARKGTPKAADAPGESEESDLLHAIRKDPKNLNLYLKLADLYIKQRQLAKAQDQYNKALEINNNAEIREQLNDLQLTMLRNDLSEAIDRARKNPGKERLVEKVKALKGDLLAKEIEFYTYSAELHPNDMKKKYELAQRLMSNKEPGKAIPLLQQAVTDPRIKVEALVMLGECFAKDGKLDIARRQFEKALEGLSGTDKPDPFKSAHYYLGRIYEKNNKRDQAEHHYGEILAVDFEYKDVRKRLEALGGEEVAGGIGD